MCNKKGIIKADGDKLVIQEDNGCAQWFVKGQYEPKEGETYEFVTLVQAGIGGGRDKPIRILTKKLP